MTTESTEHNQFTTWVAQDWDELADIWSKLLPPLDEDSDSFVPTFRGKALQPDQAGYVFERWILEAFRLDGASVDPSFKVPLPSSQKTMEQIDGLVCFEWQAFLVESKNWGKNVDFTPIALLHERIQRRPPGTLGLVFSSREFTLPAVEVASLIRPIRVLLFDRRDLDHMVLEHNMVDALRTKWHRAVKYRSPNSPIWNLLDEK